MPADKFFSEDEIEEETLIDWPAPRNQRPYWKLKLTKLNSIHRAFHGKCTGHDCDRNQPVQVSILSDLHYLYRFHSPVLSPHLNGHLERKNETTCLVRFLSTPKSIFHRTGRL